MKKVFVAGGVSWDSIIQLGELPAPKPQTVFSSSYNEVVGSTGTGKVVNMQKLGFDTTFHAMIGKDEAGIKIENYFKEKKLKFIYDEDERGSETHTNLMDSHGGRISIYTAYNTFEPKIDYGKFKNIICESDYVVLNIINYVKKIIPVAKEQNKEIWCDIHDYDGKNEYHKEFIDGADYIFMSSDQMKDYKSFMENLIKSGKKIVICTHGKNGATALTSEGKWIEEGILEKYKRVDTNGAGDAFFSGFIYGYSNGKSIRESMRYGTITAGLCVTSKELCAEEMSVEMVEKEYRENYGIKKF